MKELILKIAEYIALEHDYFMALEEIETLTRSQEYEQAAKVRIKARDVFDELQKVRSEVSEHRIKFK